MPRRIISARDQVDMLSPWRTARRIEAAGVDLKWERDGGGNWILVGRNPDGNPVAIPTERAPSVRTSARTAGPRRRFTEEYQHIGGDYFPTDVISSYMIRKEQGFGDEKSLYNKQPPLSQQVSERGYETPVELVTDGRSANILDGHHRVDTARALGHSHVPVKVYWRVPYADGTSISDNKIEPWLKSWLTDMRRGRETVGKLKWFVNPEETQ